MADKSYRIKTKIGENENVISVNLKQGIKVLNILSLEINTEDEYNIQTSDYGVIVGRVLANEAFGVPNVKVSVFIPIEDNDKSNYIVANEYPYVTPQSTDIEGVKYNLVTKKKDSPGTFPPKRMVLDNNGCVEVFDKYWKFTTTTNESGDYMIFGVPTGTCQVHYDCDLSDVGIISQHPYDFVAKGYDKNLFKSMSEFGEKDITSAVHIKSGDKSVYVYPFWGNKERNRIGITRNDIQIDYKFEPSCIFMGSSITDPRGGYIGVDGCPSGTNGRFSSLRTCSGDIEVIRKKADGTVEELTENVKNIIDGNGVWCYQIPMNLDRIGTDEYGNTIAIADPTKGIPTRARVRFRISLNSEGTDDSGEHTAKILVPCNPKLETNQSDDYQSIYMWNGHKGNDVKINEFKVSVKGLQSDPECFEDYGIYEFGDKTPDNCFRDLYWGKVYSIKQYYPRFHFEKMLTYKDDGANVLIWWSLIQIYNNDIDGLGEDDGEFHNSSLNNYDFHQPDNVAVKYDFSGFPFQYRFKQSCIFSIEPSNSINSFPYNTLYSGAEVAIDDYVPEWFLHHYGEDSKETMTQKGLHFCFENDWINGCLYFPSFLIEIDGYGNLKYFGSEDYYDKTYLSGRHYWFFKEGKPTTMFNRLGAYRSRKDPEVMYWDDDDIICFDKTFFFSRVLLNQGIIEKVKNKDDKNIFYYRCGVQTDIQKSNSRIRANGTSQLSVKVYRRLYATDIILLGNIQDIYDNLPKLYNNLPSTTSTFPPIVPPKNLTESGMSKHGYIEQIREMTTKDVDNGGNEVIDIFNTPQTLDFNFEEPFYCDDYYYNHTNNSIESEQLYICTKYPFKDDISQRGDNPSISERFYNGGDNTPQQFLINLSRRYSLFFGIRWSLVDSQLSYDIPSFVNLSRICELDVHNDSAFKAEIPKNLLDSDEELAYYQNGSFTIPVNGIIDGFDIETNKNRSAFASLNQDINKKVKNDIGYYVYEPTQMIVNGFDGRLKNYCSANYFNYPISIPFKNKEGGKKFDLNLADERCDMSYLKFRFGSGVDDGKVLTESEFLPPYGKYNLGIVEERLKLGQETIKTGFHYWFWNYANGPIYLTENSFYFYFGLRSGFSALDALRERFIGTKKEDKLNLDNFNMTIETIENTSSCVDGEQYFDCKVMFIDPSFPVEWYIHKGDISIKKGTIEKEKYSEESGYTISGVSVGNYTFTGIDKKNVVYEKNFSVFGDVIRVGYQSYLSQAMGVCVLQLNNVNSNKITSGWTDSDIVYLTYVDSSTNDNIELKCTFDNEYTNIAYNTEENNIKIYFDEHVKSVIANFQMLTKNNQTGYDCIETSYNIRLSNSISTDLELNNIPVKYINVWDNFNGTWDYEIEENHPDYALKSSGYKIWDSLGTLHPDFKFGNSFIPNRWFSFDEDTTIEEQLSCISNMFSCVINDNDMSLIDNGNNEEALRVTLSPNFDTSNQDVANRYNNPQLSSSTIPISGGTLYQISNKSGTNGIVTRNPNIPHIVGSNYPNGMYGNGSSMLKVSLGSGYQNNPTITKVMNGVSGTNFGINLFACRNGLNYSQYDEPNSGVIPTISSTTDCNYNILNPSNVKNWVGVRTVDKRFDYQFCLHTPLLLPSGYDDFHYLQQKYFIPGTCFIDLYGGVRLNYSGETRTLTSFRTNNHGFLTGGPQSGETVSGLGDGAKLYSVNFNDGSNNINEVVSESGINVWYKDQSVIDIDHVQYEINENNTHNLGTSGNAFSFNCVSCSSDFKDFIVKQGVSDGFSVSYDSGVKIKRSDLNNAYDITYNISISAETNSNNYSFGSFMASLDGSSLCVTLNNDDMWDGYTYTDVYSGSTSNLYPNWCQRDEFDNNFAGSELSVYCCSYRFGDFEIFDRYNFISQNTQGHEIDVNYDINKFVSPYYNENDKSFPLNDELSQNNVEFVIDTSSNSSSKNLNCQFIMIPTKKVYKIEDAHTQLKQGVVFNRGYVYYCSPIDCYYYKTSNTVKFVLYTPLMKNDGTVNYNRGTLIFGDEYHTIGEIDNVRCLQGNSIVFDKTKDEFTLTIDPLDLGQTGHYDIYFDIVNGLRYHIGFNITKYEEQEEEVIDNGDDIESMTNELVNLRNQIDEISHRISIISAGVNNEHDIN